MGVAIYEPYREHVRRPLFVRDPVAGMLFETKEHLAYAVLALVLGAAICALVAPRARRDLRQLAAAMFTGASGLALVVVGLGLYVASVESFASVGAPSSTASAPSEASVASGAPGASPPLAQAGHAGQLGHDGQGAASGHAGAASTTAGSAAQPSSAR
jgi:hypothetical protein